MLLIYLLDMYYKGLAIWSYAVRQYTSEYKLSMTHLIVGGGPNIEQKLL